MSSSKIIALCYSNILGENEEKQFHAIHSQLQASGYHLMCFCTEGDLTEADTYTSGEEAIFGLLPYSILEAIILLPESIKSEKVRNTIVSNAKVTGIPVITLDTPLKGCINIRFSYANSMRNLVDHILDHHHCTRVNFIAGIKDNLFSEERLDAYRQAMQEHGLPVEESRIGYGDFWAGPTIQVVDRFFEQEPEGPEAIICANDSMAIAVCARLEELGFQVPEDILVTGFDGINVERYHTPRLTTAMNNLAEAGRTIVHILGLIENGETPLSSYSIFHKLVYSQSCGCSQKTTSNANVQVLELADQLSRVNAMSVSMSHMISNLSSMPTFEDAMYRLRYYTDKIWMDSFGLYAANYTLRGSTDGLATPLMVKRNGQYITQEPFPLRQILPDFSEQIQREGALFLFPIHFLDRTLAYFTVTIPLGYNAFNLLYQLIMSMNQIMGLLSSQESLRKAADRLEIMATHDNMTGLLNRSGFYANVDSLLASARTSRHTFIVYSIDMNGLKYINDHFGHAEGDTAIKLVTQALRSCAEPSMILARFGGDEFVIAAVHQHPQEHIRRFTDQLRSTLKDLQDTLSKPYELSASIGYALSEPEQNLPLDTLLRRSDANMYEEKKKHALNRR